MQKRISVAGLAFFAFLISVAPRVAAQERCFGTSTADLEIFLEIQFEVGPTTVTVTNLETSTIVDSRVASYDTNIYEGCDWVATVGEPSGIQGAVYLEDNTLYEIEFSTSSDTITYSYFGCEPGFDTYEEGFYCPNGGDAVFADMYFIYESEGVMSLDIIVEAMNNKGPVNEYFSDTNWIVPYNLDVVCGSDQDCLDVASEVSFFVTPQLGPSFTLTSAH